MEARGIFPRFERMPLMPLDNNQMSIVRTEMARIEPFINQVKDIYFNSKR